MKILVSLKAVAEDIPESDPIFLKSAFLERDQVLKINRFDDHALEEAIKIKEENNDTIVHTITIGDISSEEILKKAIGKGADKAFLILADLNSSNDPDFVSEVLKTAFQKDEYDLLFSGMMSEDMMSGVSALMAAGKSDIPAFSGVTEINEKGAEKIIFSRETEGGAVEKIESSYPVSLNFQAGINKPSYPNVMRMLKIAKDAVVAIKHEDFCSKKESIEIKELDLPQRTRKAELLNGDINEKAEAFIKILRDKKIL